MKTKDRKVTRGLTELKGEAVAPGKGMYKKSFKLMRLRDSLAVRKRESGLFLRKQRGGTIILKTLIKSKTNYSLIQVIQYFL